MKEFEVILTKNARCDLLGIEDYFARELDAQYYGEAEVDKIREAIRTLRQMPRRFSLIGDGSERRRFRVGRYVVIYVVEGEKVVVLRVAHQKQNWGEK